MSELTDDPLDQLFRKSAEEFDPAFDPASWQAMNARLDDYDQTRPGGNSGWRNALHWGVPVVILLLLSVGSWYVYSHQNSTTDSILMTRVVKSRTGPTKRTNELVSSKLNQLADGETPAQNSKGSGNLKDNDLPAGPSAHQSDEGETYVGTKNRPNALMTRPSTVPKVGATKPTRRSYRLVKEQPQAVYKIPTTLTDQQNQSRARRRVYVVYVARTTSPNSANHSPTGILEETKKPSSTQQHSENQSEALVSNVLPGYPSLAESTKTGGFSEIAELPIRPAQWVGPIVAINRSVIAQPDTIFRRVVSSADVMRGLSVRFVVAPDLSTVGLKNFARPGTNVGLLLEYRLGSRWSIQAGVVKSTKVYKAMSADYTMPDDMKKWSVYPYGVDGRCRMIDIPINLRYDVALRPRLSNRPPSRWFVSAGVTSSIMNKEEYTYMYADPTNPQIEPTNRQGNGSAGNYGLSQFNMSAGYERSVSHRLSWQMEPFLKTPLKGVGTFNVDLLSTGIFFSLRYKL